MTSQTKLGGVFTLPNSTKSVHRMGYGAMQLAGRGVFGPPRDEDAAVAVLRAALEAGVDHIDTSDYYGPHITNQIIKRALQPYADNLTIVTKVGASRGANKSWNRADTPEELTSAVHDNLRNLGLDALEVVNYRVMGGGNGRTDESIEAQITTLAQLKHEGLIKHIGVSNVKPAQLTEAQGITPIVCVQNMYNLVHRDDDAFVDSLAAQGIAYVPFFPLGGFTPLQSSVLDEVAQSLNAKPMQVAQAWLLQRSPNILVISGTSSVAHLHENLAAASLELPADAVAKLNAIT